MLTILGALFHALAPIHEGLGSPSGRSGVVEQRVVHLERGDGVQLDQPGVPSLPDRRDDPFGSHGLPVVSGGPGSCGGHARSGAQVGRGLSGLIREPTPGPR